MKKIAVFAAILLLAFIVFINGKNAIAKAILVKSVRQMTGLGVDVRYINVSLKKTFIEVKGLNIYNPQGFNERLMADVPEAYVDFDLASLFKGKAHIEALRLHLKEFTVVKSAAGRLNINSISGISKEEALGEQRKEKVKPKPEIQIDVLELKVGRVLYRDYTQLPPGEFRYNVNIHERYENVTDVEGLVKLIVTRSLVNTAISRLAEVDFDRLKTDISGLIKKGDVFGTIQAIGAQLESIFGEREHQ
jgi:hypothetical protein